jgi:hypothetical protein
MAPQISNQEILHIKNLTIRRGGDDAALVGKEPLTDKKGLKGAELKSLRTV